MPAPPDAAVDAALALEDDLPRFVDRTVKLYQSMQRAFGETGTDCGAATARVTAIVDGNADLIEAYMRVKAGGDPKLTALRAELDKRAAEIDPAAKAILGAPTLEACRREPTFIDAVKRLDGLG